MQSTIAAHRMVCTSCHPACKLIVNTGIGHPLHSMLRQILAVAAGTGQNSTHLSHCDRQRYSLCMTATWARPPARQRPGGTCSASAVCSCWRRPAWRSTSSGEPAMCPLRTVGHDPVILQSSVQHGWGAESTGRLGSDHFCAPKADVKPLIGTSATVHELMLIGRAGTTCSPCGCGRQCLPRAA
jgi:hypothetical protein